MRAFLSETEKTTLCSSRKETYYYLIWRKSDSTLQYTCKKANTTSLKVCLFLHVTNGKLPRKIILVVQFVCVLVFVLFLTKTLKLSILIFF